MPLIETERIHQRFDNLTVDEILNTIIKSGGFVYAPRFWSEENNKLINDLLEASLIKQDDGSFNELNPSYSYVAN